MPLSKDLGSSTKQETKTQCFSGGFKQSAKKVHSIYYSFKDEGFTKISYKPMANGRGITF